MTTIAQYIGPSAKRKIRSKVGTVDKKSVYFPLEFKAAEDEDDDRLFFEGYANTTNIDRTGDRIRSSAWRKTIRDYLRYNPQVFYMHDWYLSIGQIVEAKVTKEGLWVRGYVQPPTDDNGEEIRGGMGDYIRFIRGQVKRGQLRTLSVGIRILASKAAKVKDPKTGETRDVRDITEVELFENSLVTLPANRESVVEAKNLMAELHGEEVACSLVSLFDDSVEEEDDLYEPDDFDEEDEAEDEPEDEKVGPALDLVSLRGRRTSSEPEIELVSIRKGEQDER